MKSIICLQVEKVKITDIHDPAYFLDTGAYDFGSLLVFREDKRCVLKQLHSFFDEIKQVIDA